MRRRNDPIDVRTGRSDDPVQFVWRDRLWRVLGVEHHWVESGQWWNGPLVRAARGDEVRHRDGFDLTTEVEAEGDLLCEVEVWRVEAANGMAGSRGIYEIAHAFHTGQWQMRTVVD